MGIPSGRMNLESGSTIFIIDPAVIERSRSRQKRRMYLPLAIFGAAVFIAIPFPRPFGINDPLGQGLVSLALFLLGGYDLWRQSRWLQEINSVAVTEKGLYPPTKPKQKLGQEKWFVSYKDIVSIEPAREIVGVSIYDITLHDGLTFRLNPLDLLSYVGEAKVREYDQIVRVIHAELQRHENRDKAATGEDITIPKEKFGSYTRR